MFADQLHSGTSHTDTRACRTHHMRLVCLVLLLLLHAEFASCRVVSTRPNVTEASPLNKKPPPQLSLEEHLFDCRVKCRDEIWNPVCHANTTYANDCWVNCTAGIRDVNTGAITEEGSCNRRQEDPECIFRCLGSFSEQSGSENHTQFARWRPACGEDGITYTTACFASCSGVRSAEGECQDTSPRSMPGISHNPPKKGDAKE